MISLLRGRFVSKRDNCIVVDVGGVGYSVFMAPDEALEVSGVRGEVTIHTHLNVREDDLILYGFLTPDRLEFFKTVLKVGGIGPKTALGITGAVSYKEFTLYVSRSDAEGLSRLPGIGKKTAQKMVLELQDKINVFDGEGYAEYAPSTASEVRTALEGLGFSQVEIEKCLQQALAGCGEAASAEEIIKYMLKEIGRREV